jgi:mRNA-degrading endonuclease RelE of RelBE toxin-antitoxin system
LRKLPLDEGAIIIREAKTLASFPACQNVKALTNHQYEYRWRVGRYRVFFNFDGIVSIVFIEEVKKRDEHTY